MQQLARSAPGLQASARRVADLLAGRAEEAPEVVFRALAPAPQAPPSAAVDGSHAVLADGRSVLVGFHRAAAVVLGPAGRETVTRAAVDVLTEDDAAQWLAEAGGGAPAGGPSLSSFLEERRALAEVALAREVLPRLPAGGALLLDGPLARRPGEPPQGAASAGAALAQLLAEAAARGVDVVGVCKSTGLRVGAEPVLAHVRRRARGEASCDLWCARLPVQPPRALGVSWTARLDPAQRWLFRFDVAPAPGRDAPAVLASLAPLASTATYPGYPFPLAVAHNAATVGEAEATDLKEEVRAEAERRGLDPEAWDAAFADYHDVLEGGA